MTEGVKGSDQQCHVYGIHSNASNCHADEVVNKKNVSLSMLDASPADEDNHDASHDIPGNLQVQSYAEL